MLGVTKLVQYNELLLLFSTVGVNLIMFSAGMETNFKEIKKNGIASVVITSLGVLVPLVFGFGVSWILPGLTMKERWFFGVILTATSVGITVAALKELGVLHGKVGASIVTAAIIDDIIGIVILAFFTANAGPKTIGGLIIKAAHGDLMKLSGLAVLINVFFFFVIGVTVGIGFHYLFKFISKRFPQSRRLSIFGLVTCFLFAAFAEKLFGVAAITGSFLAGMMLSNMPQSEYVERRVDMSAYMIFSPIFFASIGISMPYDKLVSDFSWLVVAFSIAFVIVGLLSKFIGCGAGAAMCKFKPNQCAKVGVGMMVRGEVCLIVANTGKQAGLIDEKYYPAIICLIIISSILTPIILKALFKKFPNEKLPLAMVGSIDTVVAVQQSLVENSVEGQYDDV
ncbi:MAG: cation:proton antiporter, partial [Clostridia bacterium]